MKDAIYFMIEVEISMNLMHNKIYRMGTEEKTERIPSRGNASCTPRMGAIGRLH